MKAIIGEDAQEITDDIVFSEMMDLQLTLMPNLTRFWYYQSGEASTYKPQSVILKDFPNLKSFIHGANYDCHFPALKEVEVDNCGLSNLFTWYVTPSSKNSN